MLHAGWFRPRCAEYLSRKIKTRSGTYVWICRAPESIAYETSLDNWALEIVDFPYDYRCAYLDFLSEVMLFKLTVSERAEISIRLSQLQDRLVKCYSPLGLNDRPSICVDTFIQLDDRSYCAAGWYRRVHGEVKEFYARAPEGKLLASIGVSFFPRDDIEPTFRGDSYLGFISLFQLPYSSPAPSGWIVGRKGSGDIFEAPCPDLNLTAEDKRVCLLNLFRNPSCPDPHGYRNLIHLALGTLQRSIADSSKVIAIHQFGSPPLDPICSVIIPLFRRLDFIEHQLVHFEHDPVMSMLDIIYVLDSPQDSPELQLKAEALSALYTTPFRLAFLSRPGGYGNACNQASLLARSNKLLFLNSDIMPKNAGWLTVLLNQLPDNAIVGAKLLFEDETIQHCGVVFKKIAGGITYEPHHIFKGLSTSVVDQSPRVQIHAVSGACLLIYRDLFSRLGGFDISYVQGDFEDCDLCLRLKKQGGVCQVRLDVELYHLEGQSYPRSSRSLNRDYNLWLFNERWMHVINSV